MCARLSDSFAEVSQPRYMLRFVLSSHYENAVEEFLSLDCSDVFNSWPKDKLTAIIQLLLEGKTLKTSLALDSTESQDYCYGSPSSLMVYSAVSLCGNLKLSTDSFENRI